MATETKKSGQDPAKSEPQAAKPEAKPEAQPKRDLEKDFDEFRRHTTEGMAELKTMLAGVASLVQGSQADDALVRPVPADYRERADRKLRRIDQQLEDAKRELAEGVRQFRCYLTGVEQKAITVGGVDEDHARAKFQRFHGIRAILNPSVRVEAEPLEPSDEALAA